MTATFWAMTGSGSGASGLPERMNRLVDLGIEGVAAAQTYGSPFVPLAAVAAAHPTLQLETAIAIASTRSPFETACSAIELDRLSEGRFTLGLGVGPKRWLDYFGAESNKPVSRVREVIEIVRHVESCASRGTIEDLEGDFWRLRFEGLEPLAPPERAKIPIYVAALREKVCELAGECADGLIGHPVWSVDHALKTALPAVETGARSTGRDPAEIGFQSFVTASVDTDPARATELAKPFVAFYGGIAQYRSYFDAHGFGREADRLARAAETMSCREAASLVPDEMVRTFAACGSPDDVLEWLEPLRERASSIVVLPPGWGLAPQELMEKTAAIEEVWRRA